MKWFLALNNRPVTVMMSILSLFIMGSIAAERIPLQMLPAGLEARFISLTWFGLSDSPEQNEQDVAKVAEGYLSTLRNLKSLTMTSASGSVRALVEYRSEVDMS